MIYLNTYQPLCSTNIGQQAIKKYDISPYVDGSCRREPDFDHEFPSISALCRGRLFAPKLKENDKVVYMTHKNTYGQTCRHWKLVAVMEVIKRTTHQGAFDWYKSKGLRIPTNCIAGGNLPLPKDMTVGSNMTIHQWEYHYKNRARDYDVFLICRHIEPPCLVSPAPLFEKDFIDIMSKQPQTRIPSSISIIEMDNLIIRAAHNSKLPDKSGFGASLTGN